MTVSGPDILAGTESMPTCFVIAPIGSPDSEEREHSDNVLKHIVSPVMEGLGYTVIRADRITQQGAITNQVLELVLDSEIVIAVLTYRNPNVFYELAVRHAVHKPFVHLVDDAGSIPFDLVSDRAIVYRLDLDGVAEAKTALTAAVAAVQSPDYRIDSPVSRVANLEALSGSDSKVEVALGGIRTDIESLRQELGRRLPPPVERKPGDPVPMADVQRLVEQRLALERGDRDEKQPPELRTVLSPAAGPGSNPVLQLTLGENAHGQYRIEGEILGDLQASPPVAVIHMGGEQLGQYRPFPGVYKRHDLGSFEPRQMKSFSAQPNPGIGSGMVAAFRFVIFELADSPRAWQVTRTFTIPEHWSEPLT